MSAAGAPSAADVEPMALTPDEDHDDVECERQAAEKYRRAYGDSRSLADEKAWALEIRDRARADPDFGELIEREAS